MKNGNTYRIARKNSLDITYEVLWKQSFRGIKCYLETDSKVVNLLIKLLKPK